MSNTDDEPVEIEYEEIVSETGAAICFRVPTYASRDFSYETQEMWIPKSQLIEHDEDGHTFEVPEWLARDRGMV